MINLKGLTRFKIDKEVNNDKLYREFKVEYKKFYQDLENTKLQTIEEKTLDVLLKKIKLFLKKSGFLL